MFDDLRLALMAGTDIPIPQCQLVIHQPRIREIALLGEKNFLSAAQCFCLNKNMFKSQEGLLEDVSNFDIFIMILNDKEGRKKREDVLNLTNILVPSHKALITPRSLVFNSSDSSIIIDENNFEILQKVLREVFCVSSSMAGNSQNFNPAGNKAKEIAEKLMRGRQRVAAQNGEAQASMFAQYLSILTIGLNSMSLDDCLNLTIFQMYDLVERYQLYISYDIDIRSRLAGAKSDGKPDNWMKNIH